MGFGTVNGGSSSNEVLTQSKADTLYAEKTHNHDTTYEKKTDLKADVQTIVNSMGLSGGVTIEQAPIYLSPENVQTVIRSKKDAAFKYMPIEVLKEEQAAQSNAVVYKESFLNGNHIECLPGALDFSGRDTGLLNLRKNRDIDMHQAKTVGTGMLYYGCTPNFSTFDFITYMKIKNAKKALVVEPNCIKGDEDDPYNLVYFSEFIQVPGSSFPTSKFVSQFAIDIRGRIQGVPQTGIYDNVGYLFHMIFCDSDTDTMTGYGTGEIAIRVTNPSNGEPKLQAYAKGPLTGGEEAKIVEGPSIVGTDWLDMTLSFDGFNMVFFCEGVQIGSITCYFYPDWTKLKMIRFGTSCFAKDGVAYDNPESYIYNGCSWVMDVVNWYNKAQTLALHQSHQKKILDASNSTHKNNGLINTWNLQNDSFGATAISGQGPNSFSGNFATGLRQFYPGYDPLMATDKTIKVLVQKGGEGWGWDGSAWVKKCDTYYDMTEAKWKSLGMDNDTLMGIGKAGWQALVDMCKTVGSHNFNLYFWADLGVEDWIPAIEMGFKPLPQVVFIGPGADIANYTNRVKQITATRFPGSTGGILKFAIIPEWTEQKLAYTLVDGSWLAIPIEDSGGDARYLGTHVSELAANGMSIDTLNGLTESQLNAIPGLENCHYVKLILYFDFATDDPDTLFFTELGLEKLEVSGFKEAVMVPLIHGIDYTCRYISQSSIEIKSIKYTGNALVNVPIV